MKQFLLAGAVAAGFATSALAADAGAGASYGAQGFLGGGFSSGSVSGFGSGGVTVLAVGGAVNVPLSGGLNIELEAAGAQMNFSGGSGSDGYARGQVHVFLRNPGWAIGGFGGFEQPIVGLGLTNVGVEAQSYWSNMNLTGQLAWVNWATSGPSSTAVSARAGVKLFLTDNIAFDGDVRWMSTSVAGGSSFTISGGAEARVAGTPWSLFGNARWTNITTTGPTIQITTGLVGARAHLGNFSLFQQYRGGASFNTLPLF